MRATGLCPPSAADTSSRTAGQHHDATVWQAGDLAQRLAGLGLLIDLGYLACGVHSDDKKHGRPD